MWNSKYLPFKKKGIPEISDLNVLLRFQKRGVATLLMNAAECLISERGNIAGLGVGVTADYGAALRLYVCRGYFPDGLGIARNGKTISHGEEIVVDDDVNLYFLRELRII